ncbi:MAG TPA: hypothetical protein VFS00_24085, partial [Polyangiaceae bacterium]|nr:hypothetical protein [Polyangiaceae bacterium]
GLAAACGSSPAATSSEGIPLVAPPPGAGPRPTELATTAPAASASASASALAAKPPPPAGGAPMAIIDGDTEVATTIGYRGGKVRLSNGAELTLPPGALADGLAFTFGLTPAKGPQAVTPHRGALGPTYKITIRRVEGGETIGSAVAGATTPLTTEGPPLVLKLPLPANAKAGNLALATTPDPKKPAFKVYPPSSVETGEPAKAVFQMNSLPGEGALHLTSADPTEKP